MPSPVLAVIALSLGLVIRARYSAPTVTVRVYMHSHKDTVALRRPDNTLAFPRITGGCFLDRWMRLPLQCRADQVARRLMEDNIDGTYDTDHTYVDFLGIIGGEYWFIADLPDDYTPSAEFLPREAFTIITPAVAARFRDVPWTDLEPLLNTQEALKGQIFHCKQGHE